MSAGTYKFLADALVVFHICFVGFVLFGGAVVLWWRRAMWMHLPAVAWGIYIELSHNICPLTPLENHLRQWGGAATYQGGFVDHYIMPVLYPSGLTHAMQVGLAVVIVLLNAGVYGWIVAGRRIGARARPPMPHAKPPAATAQDRAETCAKDAPVSELAAATTRDVP